jgi:hypothetical protein
MYTLIIDCSNFALEHSAHAVDGNGDLVAVMRLKTEDIGKFIAQDNRITEVKLSGIQEYCLGIKEDIENKVALEYANNENRKVIVEVI